MHSHGVLGKRLILCARLLKHTKLATNNVSYLI
uniref:Uncharacterized protein n=1 Tax=Anguilla anguilla TaxID=7936 RepID=A0A0E9WAD5_ANGAN